MSCVPSRSKEGILLQRELLQLDKNGVLGGKRYATNPGSTRIQYCLVFKGDQSSSHNNYLSVYISQPLLNESPQNSFRTLTKSLSAPIYPSTYFLNKT